MGDDKTLKKHLSESEFHKELAAREGWRQIIDVDIPTLMVIDGLTDGTRYDIVPLYDVIDFWYRKYKGGYSLGWTDMMRYVQVFMIEWERDHHPSLTIRNKLYGGHTIPCIVLKSKGDDTEGEV